MSDSVEQRVKAIVVELFLGGDESYPLEPETNLIADGICDSLGLVRLAAELERGFEGLSIQDQDVTHENMGSIRAIADHIRTKGAAG